MLELKDVCFEIEKNGEPFQLIKEVSIKIPRGHFMAIVGPSGCGKSTLLKTIAGLNEESAGSLHWDGRNLAEEGDLEPWEIGYVPQFSIAFDQLTVDESIESAARLRICSKNNEELNQRLDRVLEECGLADIADRPVKVLSGGQKRRLGLAMELVSDPKLLLCDEVTSGLDPRSERDIVRLLHQLSRHGDRIILSVTHSLAHLELYDSILVLHEGAVAYHGPPELLTHYFSVEQTESIYPRLAKRESQSWRESWAKHQSLYYDKIQAKSAGRAAQSTSSEPSTIKDETEQASPSAASTTSILVGGESRPEPSDPETPGIFSQFFTLLQRRWKIFLRDKGQVALQIAILLCFPLLVTLFSQRGNENMRRLSDSQNLNVMQEMQQQAAVQQDQLKVGSAVSGIIMFQVVLLSLMGSNNAAREIAGERQIMEKEKFGGVSPLAYLMSKIAFLSTLILAQSIWMGVFVEFFWPFPAGSGGLTHHLIFLVLVNAAMTSVCLGISALMKTAEQASLLSVYLVGFQLPLSGAVLALPEKIEAFTRPFISAYWAWSGSVNSLSEQHYRAVSTVIETTLSASPICLFVLVIHVLVGLLAAWLGSLRHQWEH